MTCEINVITEVKQTFPHWLHLEYVEIGRQISTFFEKINEPKYLKSLRSEYF